MLRETLSRLFATVRDQLIAEGRVPEAVREATIEISDTKSVEHGDFACNLAMVASKKAGMNPRALAELFKPGLEASPLVNAVEIAGPGFINLRLDPSEVAGRIPQIVAAGDRLAYSEAAQPLAINIEFVSVNPNGPITVGSGRGAAFGSALASILEAAGHDVHREYYINDGVNSEQMRLFAESVRSYAQSLPFPEKGYRGEYVKDVAAAIGQPDEAEIGWWQSKSQDLMIQRQRDDLAGFGVWFNTWFSEQSLHNAGKVEELLDQLQSTGVADVEPKRTKLKLGRGGVIESVEVEAQSTATAETEDEHDGPAGESEAEGETLWLRSTKFGDDMDRVLRRRDGRLTYIASDVAYHADKFHRGNAEGTKRADKLITVLGPDHHGYIARLQAVVGALLESTASAPKDAASGEPLNENDALIYGSPEERDACQAALAEARRRLEVVIFQIVRFVKDGQPAPMRKRDGNIYELRDLISELGSNMAPHAEVEEQQRIGRDVARFFYLMRSHDTHMDFDIDLATKQSDENPVFYVQYAHARICSVLEKAVLAGFTYSEAADWGLLKAPQEQALLRKIMDLPFEVQRTAQDYAVNRLTNYAVELARSYHHFYDACRVIQADQPELSRARVALCAAARTALRSTLKLLGVSAPNRMDRAES